MYMYHRWGKETEKASLEEAGITSQSKALQIILEHLGESLQYQSKPMDEGYLMII
jgi:hypothetical protein